MAQETTTEKVTTVSTAETTTPPVTNEHPQKVYEKKKAIFRTHQIIWYILAVIEVLLAFRMVFKALGANPYSGFATLIYTLSDPLAYPFSGILRTSIAQDSIFEWSTIVAAVVYALIAYGIVYLIHMMKPVSPDEVEKKVDSH